MAITLYGSSSTPADNGSQAGPIVAVTPPASMLAGDLVVLIGQYRGTTSPSVNTTGGQTWTQEASNTVTTNVRTTIAWATFNGTWTTNPDMTVGAGNTAAFTVRMVVFRPTATTYTWSRQVAQQTSNVGAPVAPFTVTRAGQTTSGIEATVTVALWASADDNTWGSLSGAGWSQLGTQVRNTTGQDQSQALAYYIQASGGATGSVSLNQLTLGGDATATSIVSFAEVPPIPGAAGDLAATLPIAEARLTTPATLYPNPVRATQPSWHGRRRKAGLALFLVPAFLPVTTDDRTGAQVTALPPVAAAMAGTVERLGDAAVTLAPVTAEVAGTVGEQSGASFRIRASYPVPQGRRRHYGAITLRDPVPGVNDLQATLPAATAALDGTSEYLAPLASTLGAVTASLDGSVEEFALQRNPGWQRHRYIHGRRHQYGAIILAPSRLAESALIVPMLPPVAALDGAVVNPDVYAAGRGPKGVMVTQEARQRAVWRRGQVGMAWLSAAPIFTPSGIDILATIPGPVAALTGAVANNLGGELTQALVAPVMAATGTVANFAGELVMAPPGLTSALDGTFAPNYEGDINSILPQLAPSANVASPIVGDLVMLLPAAVHEGGGTSTPDAIEGQIVGTLGVLTSALDGTFVPITGNGNPSLPTLAIEVEGTFVPAPIAGDLAATLPALIGLDSVAPTVEPPVGGGRAKKSRRADSLLAFRTATLDAPVPPKKVRRKKKRALEITPEAPATEATDATKAVQGTVPAPFVVTMPASLDLPAIARKRKAAKVTPQADLTALSEAEITEIMGMIEKILEQDDG